MLIEVDTILIASVCLLSIVSLTTLYLTLANARDIQTNSIRIDECRDMISANYKAIMGLIELNDGEG